MEETIATSGEPEGTWDIQLITGSKGFASPREAPSLTIFQNAIETKTGKPCRDIVAIGASDARYFADDGIILMTFGPGHAKDGHKANEFVPVADLEAAALIQLSVIEQLLGFAN